MLLCLPLMPVEFFSQDLEDFAEVEVPDNGNNVQAPGGEDTSDEPVENSTEPTRDQLLSVLRVLFEQLNLKKYAVAYTQYLVDKYGIQDINELTVAHINEQISVLQQCIDSKRKYNQLIKILGQQKVAAVMILAMNPVRNGRGSYKISFGIYAAGTIKHKPLSIPLQGPSAAGAGSRLTVRSWPRLWCRLRFLAPANRKQAEKAASLLLTLQRMEKDLSARLKEWVKENGPIQVGDLIYGATQFFSYELDPQLITTTLLEAGIKREAIWQMINLTKTSL